jgi:hypothetical protein
LKVKIRRKRRSRNPRRLRNSHPLSQLTKKLSPMIYRLQRLLEVLGPNRKEKWIL